VFPPVVRVAVLVLMLLDSQGRSAVGVMVVGQRELVRVVLVVVRVVFGLRICSWRVFTAKIIFGLRFTTIIMGSKDLAKLKRQAMSYVEEEVYAGSKIETQVMGTTNKPSGIRVGVAANKPVNGFLGKIKNFFTGGMTYYYVTVTINPKGQVVMFNKNLSKAEFYHKIDRKQEARAARRQQERREQFWEEKRQEAIEDMMDDSLSTDDNSSVPDRCPKCKESGDILQSQFKKLDEKQYQCKNENCGYIVNLKAK